MLKQGMLASGSHGRVGNRRDVSVSVTPGKLLTQRPIPAKPQCPEAGVCQTWLFTVNQVSLPDIPKENDEKQVVGRT